MNCDIILLFQGTLKSMVLYCFVIRLTYNIFYTDNRICLLKSKNLLECDKALHYCVFLKYLPNLYAIHHMTETMTSKTLDNGAYKKYFLDL